MTKINDHFRELMRSVFDELREGLRAELSEHDYNEKRELFAFHMSDSMDDIVALRDLGSSAEIAEPETAAKMIPGILFHVVPHLCEAGYRLLDGVPNGFEAEREADEKNQGSHF